MAMKPCTVSAIGPLAGFRSLSVGPGRIALTVMLRQLCGKPSPPSLNGFGDPGASHVKRLGEDGFSAIVAHDTGHRTSTALKDSRIPLPGQDQAGGD